MTPRTYLRTCFVAAMLAADGTTAAVATPPPTVIAADSTGGRLADGRYLYRIAFYNVENLFYPTRDSGIADEDYTPTGSRHWSWAKFETKCHRIFKVISALDAENPLLCIGLAEVENRRVLQQLCYGTPLRHDHYDIVHFDSPDRRGIDVALLYRADRLEILQARPLAVGRDPGAPQFATRDILAVQARIRTTGDTLYLFVVHFPSKFGGALATDARRRQAGHTLRGALDSVLTRHPQAKLLAMGDFNATADEAALKESIGYTAAKPSAPNGPQKPQESQVPPVPSEPSENPSYINLMAAFPPDIGSHKYRETWSLIDHIIVNRPLLAVCRRQDVSGEGSGRYRRRAPDRRPTLYAAIFNRDFLLTEDQTYFGRKPFRTFVGPVYKGGYSDHLPVYVDLLSPIPAVSPPETGHR